MKTEEIVGRLRDMLGIALEIGAGTSEIGLAGDIDRIVAIIKEKIRVLDPSDGESVDYFDLNR